jgi:hypothetical protein
VALCLPYTRIKEYLNTFFGLQISTAGLSSRKLKLISENLLLRMSDGA